MRWESTGMLHWSLLFQKTGNTHINMLSLTHVIIAVSEYSRLDFLAHYFLFINIHIYHNVTHTHTHIWSFVLDRVCL